MWRSVLFLFAVGCGSESFQRMIDVPDAAPDAADAFEASAPDTQSIMDDDACVPAPFLFDGDGDGFGGTTVGMQCAESAQWTTVGGDCDDGNADVHPNQTSFFATGYVPSGKTDISFDYDCDGKETESGASPKAACQVQNLACVGSGYLPAMPARTGQGVDAFCGSTSSVVCSVQNLACKPGAPQQAQPIGCR